MFSQNKLDVDTKFLCLVIIVSYFMVLAHKYLFEIHGGLIRTWIPTALLLFILSVKYFMTSSSIKMSFKRDALYRIKLILFIYMIIFFLALITHGVGLHYIAKYAVQLYSPVALFMLIVLLAKDNFIIRKILILLFLVGVVWSATIEYDYLLGAKSMEVNDPTLISGVSVGSSRHGSYGFGINTYAAMLIPLPLVGLYLKNTSSSFLKKGLYFVLSILLSAALFMTISRAAIVSLLVGIFTILWHNLFRSSKRLRYVVSALFILAILIVLTASNKGIIIRFLMMSIQIPVLANSEYIQNKVLESGIHIQEEGHFETISNSLTLFKGNFMFGAGFNKVFNEAEDALYEHNYYIRLIAAAGLLCFILFWVFLASMVIITRKTMMKTLNVYPSDNGMGLVLYAGLLAFIFYLNAAPSEFYFYWIWFGLTAAWVRNSTHRRKHEAIAY